MAITIEFYGIPRQRAGVATTEVATQHVETTLGTVIAALASSFPELADQCFDGDRLAAGCTANVAGERFVRDADSKLLDGQSLLIMSTDAGG